MYNSTIRTQKKTCQSCGKLDYWFSKKRCAQCAKIEDFRAKGAKEAEDDLGDLIKDADAITSRYVRLLHSDKDGVIICYTCQTKMDYHDAQCGHFIGRSNFYLRYDLRNLRPQCNGCNCYKHGNLGKYRKFLNEEHLGLPDILYEESHLIHHVGRDELRAIIADYTQRIKLLNK